MAGRLRRSIAALCSCVLTASGCASTGGGTPIRIVTYNVHAGIAAGGSRNLEHVAALLRDSIAADVVLLQEIDRGTRRSAGEDQLGTLARLTGMNAAFGRSLGYQGGDYGIAVLSRWPILSDSTVPLVVEPPQERSEKSYEPRVALHTLIDAPDGPLHVLNTHLDPQRAGTYRRQELVGLMAYAQRAVPADARLVLGGDLNTRPATDEIAALSLAMTDAWSRCGGVAPAAAPASLDDTAAAADGGAARAGGETFPSTGPDRRIDYLFLRGVNCGSARVVMTSASDHLPLLVILERH